MENKPLLSIIIVNWNAKHFLRECIESIVRFPPSVPYEIVVVDNASTDDSFEQLKSSDFQSKLNGARLELIQTGENLGFAKANNLAIEKGDAPFVFALNPDTLVKEQAIDKLLETLQSSPQIGACAPKLLNTDGTIQFSVWSDPPNTLQVLVEGLKLHRFIPHRKYENWLYRQHWHYAKRQSVPLVSGAAIMAKREMISDVGAFDDSIYMYGEDAEWCIRMRRAGWLVYFEPEAQIIHHGGQSAAQRWDLLTMRVKEEKAMIQFNKRFLPPRTFTMNMLARFLILNLYKFRRRLQGKKDDNLSELIAMYAAFFNESLFNKKQS